MEASSALATGGLTRTGAEVRVLCDYGNYLLAQLRQFGLRKDNFALGPLMGPGVFDRKGRNLRVVTTLGRLQIVDCAVIAVRRGGVLCTCDTLWWGEGWPGAHRLAVGALCGLKMLPPVLEIYVVWHPGDHGVAAAADQLFRHFPWHLVSPD